MTIAVGLLAADGVVLGADSTVTIFTAEETVSSLLTGAQKIFQLGMNRPYGLVFFGAGSFGSRSYRDLLVQFERQLGGATPPVREVAQRFYDFGLAIWPAEAERLQVDPQVLPDTGVLVGGCGAGEDHCCFARVHFRPGEEVGGQPVVHFDLPGQFLFEGCPDAAHRLLHGFDAASWQTVAEFIPPADREAALESLLAPSLIRPAPTPTLPLRDAVDYVHWIVHATIKYYKFVEGPQVCGGKVEIACVTADRGFRWVTHKSLDWCVGDAEGQTEYSPVDPHRLGR
jgi:hypothetical protein